METNTMYNNIYKELENTCPMHPMHKIESAEFHDSGHVHIPNLNESTLTCTVKRGLSPCSNLTCSDLHSFETKLSELHTELCV